MTGDGIAVAICESRKIALKMYMTQYIVFNFCHVSERLLEHVWAVTAGLWSVGSLFLM